MMSSVSSREAISILSQAGGDHLSGGRLSSSSSSENHHYTSALAYSLQLKHLRIQLSIILQVRFTGKPHYHSVDTVNPSPLMFSPIR